MKEKIPAIIYEDVQMSHILIHNDSNRRMKKNLACPIMGRISCIRKSAQKESVRKLMQLLKKQRSFRFLAITEEFSETQTAILSLNDSWNFP